MSWWKWKKKEPEKKQWTKVYAIAHFADGLSIAFDITTSHQESEYQHGWTEWLCNFVSDEHVIFPNKEGAAYEIINFKLAYAYNIIKTERVEEND